MLFATLLLIIFNINLILTREICYGDLGCFTDAYPFSNVIPWRPIAFLPDKPEKISTKFTLYNKQTSSNGEIVTASNLGSNYDPNKGTKFIIHGFIQHAFVSWVLEMKDSILSVDDVNVISVDWSKGNGLPYTQATANTQVVGAELAKLVNTMISSTGAKASDFHCIGHSLGSHICGYAGSRIPSLGRITGLDPAGPYFDNTDKRVRLDPTDAVFVEAIHTDGTATLQIGLGIFQAVGHIDYYPNGGKNQPGCPEVPGKLLGAIFNGITLNIEGIEETTACSHTAAITFYTASIKDRSCKFTAYPCKSQADFDSGKCMKCSSPQSCNTMGYWSSPSLDRGSLYLNTKNPDAKPSCYQNFGLTLYSSSSNIFSTKGWFSISFKTTTQQTSTTESFESCDDVFKPKSVDTRLISLAKPITGSIESATIRFTRTNNILILWMYADKWSFSHIEVEHGERQEKIKLCPVTAFIQSTQGVEFKRC